MVVRVKRSYDSPRSAEVVDDHLVVLVDQLAGGHALVVGQHQDRGAVLVGAADHEDVVARHPHEPAEDVGGHAETGDVADVARAVGVRPGDGGQDTSHGRKPSDRTPPGFPGWRP